jgi:hypothetical protein
LVAIGSLQEFGNVDRTKLTSRRTPTRYPLSS